MKAPLPLLIAGATATGKSAVALELARLLDGEIISVDSMQVYRGLDIGTAKPNSSELREITHHLIDVRELTSHFDAAAFVREAEFARAAISARGRVPIFCGGTGLYFKAWLEGLGTAPPGDPTLRLELEQRSLLELLEELYRLDPQCYDSIDRRNKRRVLRAVEVIRLSGRPYSAQRAAWNQERRPAFAIGIERSSSDLRQRIEQRVDTMFAEGLVVETRRLLPALRGNQTAAQAIGYRQLIEHFDGKLGLPATIDAVKTKTRQFAKRQRTWFKHQMQLEWIAADELSDLHAIGREIAQRYRAAASTVF